MRAEAGLRCSEGVLAGVLWQSSRLRRVGRATPAACVCVCVRGMGGCSSRQQPLLGEQRDEPPSDHDDGRSALDTLSPEVLIIFW